MGCAAFLLLGAWAFPRDIAQKSDIVGAWTGADGATLIFAADGRVVVRDVPAGYLAPGEGARTVSFVSHWGLDEVGGESVEIDLPKLPLSSPRETIYFSRHYKRPQLFLEMGDPDAGPSYFFERAVIIPKPKDLPPRLP